MIEGFDASAPVIVNLVNPKEKFWGLLQSLTAVGLTVRAVNLDTFEDWIHQIARGEERNIDVATMFVPLFRVERIFLDETIGSVISYAARFEQVVGCTVREYFGLEGAQA